MLKTIIHAGVLVALLTGPVLAQSLNMLPTERKRSPEQIQRDKEIDQQYRDTISQIPDKKVSKDPWGNVRQASPAKQPATAGRRQP